jgi:hypothetical protein
MNPEKLAIERFRGWPKASLWLLVLLVLFGLAQWSLPLRTAVQIGADEGFELAKVTLCLHGHQLYTEVWNDQPPLHTFLVTQLVKYVSHSVLVPRLVTSFFTVIMLISMFLLVLRFSGLAAAVIAVAILLASPGFLELSASCMLEIPALAMAVGALCVLANWPAGKALPVVVAGVLFGAAILIKLISLIWIPLAVLLICQRMTASRPDAGSVALFPSLFSTLKSPSFIRHSLLFMGALAAAALAIDWLVDDGAFWLNFQQSWQSHFSAATSSAYGSASEHRFDWMIFLRNWDTTIPAVIGGIFALSKIKTNASLIMPMVWLLWSLLVFSNHTPWWPYYYIHLALPLSWMAALGFLWLSENRLAKAPPISKRRTKPKQRVPVALTELLCLGACMWMVARVYYEMIGVKTQPKTFSSLVIMETQRYRPYAHWLYADDIALSYYADIPMPPSLAVVPLKRLWSGGMTGDLLAEEFDRYRPELAILNNAAPPVPFHDLLDSNYRLVYQDDRYQLFASTNIIRQARAR